MRAREYANQLREQLAECLTEPIEFRGEITLAVTDPNRIQEVCAHAKHALGFDYLVDITSIDNFGDDPRFTLVYELYGFGPRCHIRLKTSVSEECSELPTVSSVWRTADWHEREIYDMMGIRFRGHPDLRRILMWEGYPYFPLRKDFPLAGKSTDLPDVAFTKPSPLEGGPFVTTAGAKNAGHKEPRAKDFESSRDSRSKSGRRVQANTGQSQTA